MSLKLVQFESLGAVFYSPSIVTVAVSVAVIMDGWLAELGPTRLRILTLRTGLRDI